MSFSSRRIFLIYHWFSILVVADDFNMNAVMRLNQYRPGLEFRLITQTGPVHEPVFTMAVELLGKTYEASGPSKKVAKLNVATKARWKPCTMRCLNHCIYWLEVVMHLLSVYSQVLQDLGLPTGAEPKPPSSIKPEDQPVKSAPTASSATSEDVGLAFFPSLFQKCR